MTLLTKDAKSRLSARASAALVGNSLGEILYADDTLIMGSCAVLVAEYAAAIEQAGNDYGMTLHWGKTQALSMCTDSPIRRPDGSIIESTGSLNYLGGIISADGRVDSEISRKIGTATADIRALRAAWNHTGLAQKQSCATLTQSSFPSCYMGSHRYGSLLLKSAASMDFMPGAYGACCASLPHTYRGCPTLLSYPVPEYAHCQNNCCTDSCCCWGGLRGHLMAAQ